MYWINITHTCTCTVVFEGIGISGIAAFMYVCMRAYACVSVCFSG